MMVTLGETPKVVNKPKEKESEKETKTKETKKK